MKYNLAFTAGALLYKESIDYIKSIEDVVLYIDGEDRPDYSVLSTNSESSKKRLKHELDRRLPLLNKSYLENFISLSVKDRKCILFLAFCKSYTIMTEFVIEVLYEKWKIFDFDVSTYDFEYFLSEKLGTEQMSITEKTRYKLAQVAIKTLKEVGLLSSDKIEPIKPSVSFIELLKKEDDLWFLNCLLITNPNQLV